MIDVTPELVRQPGVVAIEERNVAASGVADARVARAGEAAILL